MLPTLVKLFEEQKRLVLLSFKKTRIIERNLVQKIAKSVRSLALFSSLTQVGIKQSHNFAVARRPAVTKPPDYRIGNRGGGLVMHLTRAVDESLP